MTGEPAPERRDAPMPSTWERQEITDADLAVFDGMEEHGEYSKVRRKDTE